MSLTDGVSWSRIRTFAVVVAGPGTVQKYHPVSVCLGGDSYPRRAVVGAVINVDGVAAGVLSAPVDVLVLPDHPRVSAIRPEERDVRPGRSTARSSARLRYSQESEVVSAIPKKVKL